MPRSDTDRRTRALGGAVGVVVLTFALVYHFFPGLLNMKPGKQAAQAPPGIGGSRAPLMGFEQRPKQSSSTATDELHAGPPLSLAPSAVITARLEAHNNPPPPATSSRPESPQVVGLLDKARKAMADGRLVQGKDNAAALIGQALKLQPDSYKARQAMSDLRMQMVGNIEQSLAAGDANAASQGLGQLRQLPGTGDEVQHLQHSLKTLRQVQPLLAQATQDLQKQPVSEKDREDALTSYRKVLDIDPHNSVAEQGIQRIQQVSLDAALSAAAQNDFKTASKELAQAAEISPDSQSLQNVRGRIEGIRRARAKSLLSQAETALDAGNLNLARKLKAQAVATSPDVAGLDTFDKKLSNAQLYSSYSPGQVFRDTFLDSNGKGPRMVVIPTGTFEMGSADDARGHESDEAPQHQVTIGHGFAMQRSEVTVAQFRTFVRASGYVPDSDQQRLGGASVYDESSGTMRDDPDATWKDDYEGRPAADDMPVVNVSFRDARAYARWLSKKTGKTYRLPSEAEYEYAMRGGTTTLYWWGNGEPQRRVENLTGGRDRSRRGRRWTNSFRNYHDGYWGPAPVASFMANPFGLYDIDGNVSEWTEDCWHQNYIRAPDNGAAWVNPGCALRVVRGGSWGSSPMQDRSAYRLAVSASTRSGRVGFRVVRTF